MNKPVNVLLIDDSGDDVESTVETLRSAGFEATHRRVQTAGELTQALAMERWDAVISGIQMSTSPSFDALTIFRSANLDIPFIVLSSTLVEEAAVNAIKAGASDYITKGRLTRLAPVLERELEETQLRIAHRQAQRDLVESEARFRSLTALSSDWYWEQDEELRFIYVSAALRDKYSEALESWAGKTRWELPYCNADWTEHRATVEARKPFYDIELQPFSRDGRIVHVSVSGEPKVDSQGHFFGYRGVGKDITERVKNAEALRLFRTAMDATLDAITLVSRKTLRFVEVNATAARMLGYSRAELLQLGPSQVSQIPLADLELAYDSLIAGDSTYGVTESRLQRKNGSHFYVEVRQHAHRVGQEWIIVGVVRDHTDRKEAQEKLQRLNRLYAMASATNALVVRVRDRHELFKEACRIAVEHGEFQEVWIGLVEANGINIAPVASAGIDEEALAAIKVLLGARNDGTHLQNLAFRAITEKIAFVSNDAQNDVEVVFGKRFAESGIRSLAVLPLIAEDEAIGVLTLYTRQLEFFDAEGLQLLTGLADNVAFAIDHLEKEERLNYLAYYDDLTGLANRRLFLDRVTQYMRSAVAGRHKLALLLLDLERFKKINDSLGRRAGDELLQLVAKWLTANAGDVNVLARVGADNFALVMPQVLDETEVVRALEQTMHALMNQPFRLGDTVYRIAAKAGIGLFPDDGADADALYTNVEAALKKAKVGGERYLFYAQKMTETTAGSLGVENRLRHALEREEFVLHYQPKVNIANGKITGAEALIRWKDSQTGLVPPARFIPILEETGLIHEVGSWALRKALSDHHRWCDARYPAPRVAVNVSPLQLRSRHFIAELSQIISATPGAARGLELELTENVIMEDVDRSIESLLAIRSFGVAIAIDDFGTGFSSLNYLAKLPVDTLKIDRSFVTDMVSGAAGLKFVAVMIDLAHALTLNVVAEGVETEHQRRELRALGCDEIQGYLIGKPVPVEVFERTYLRPSAG